MKKRQMGRGGDGEMGRDEASTPKFLPISPSPLLPLFLLALALRCVGLTWGLPNAGRWYSYHPDESTRQIVGAVVSLLQGGFNPHFFNYPSLSIYATWLIYQLMAGFGLATNAISPAYPWPIVHDVILAGRIFSAVCGALTAPLVFLIARRLGMGRAAILAGILAALAPGHVQHSHFATVDVPATFFVVWCLYLTLRAENLRGFVWAAVVAGLAAGTKYNAGLVVVAPLVAVWLQADAKKRRLAIPLLLLAALGAFLVSTPYALLAPKEFWGSGQNGFAYELLRHPREGSGDIFQGTGNGWVYHLTFNLPFVLTWPVVLAAEVGILFAAKKRAMWPLLAFAALFFFSLGFSQVRYMRYLLPLAPLLCLWAAYGAARLPQPRIWGALVAVFALIGSFNVLWPFTQTDPRDQAAQVLRGKSVALVGNPWFYTPPFQPRGDNTPVAGIAVTNGQIGPSPFAISEFEWREALRLGNLSAPAIARIKQSSARFQRFKNSVPLSLPGRDFVPHDYLYTNPEIRIY